MKNTNVFHYSTDETINKASVISILNELRCTVITCSEPMELLNIRLLVNGTKSGLKPGLLPAKVTDFPYVL